MKHFIFRALINNLFKKKNRRINIMSLFVNRYPSRYGLYLKDKPNTVVVPLEYEPEDKPISSGKD